MQKCNKCGFMHYISDGCRKPKESARVAETGPRQDGGNSAASIQGGGLSASRLRSPKADANSSVQKPKHKDRHKPGYMASYLRKWRRGEVGNKYKKEMGK